MSLRVSTYSVQLSVFEGPLDLLLQLIERAELDITSVALAAVTDQYLQHLRQLQQRDIGDLSSFLVIAAKLLQIKSEALLPRPPDRAPEEESPADSLARQLIIYKRYKEVATLLHQREEAGLRSYPRMSPTPVHSPKADLTGLTAEDLRKALIEAMLSPLQGTPPQEILAMPRVRLRDKIVQILAAIRGAGSTTFARLTRVAKTRLEIVVSFLAMLELIKQRQVVAQQGELFGEITITPGERWQDDQRVEFELEFEE